MKLTFFLLILLYGGIISNYPDKYKCIQSIEKNGMKVFWSFKADKVRFEVFAPTKGWLAIGINEKGQLVKSNLIMGNVITDHTTISDQFIVGLGDHQPVENLKGINHISQIDGYETKKGTAIHFSISAKAMDTFHYDLEKGKEITFLLAYSEEDDFEHHSSMRTSIKIIL